MTDRTPDASNASASTPKPIGPVHLTVLVLFAIGVLAIPTLVIAGVLVGFDALGAVIGVGAACLVLAALWSYGRDTSIWVGATMRIARTRGLLPTDKLTPFSATESVERPDLTLADDSRRLDRRRVTRIVAAAQRRDPKLKQRRPTDD